MIQNPILIVLILFAVVTTARWWHERFRETWIMRFLPTPVLCYIPPTLLTTLGILPFKSQVYDWISAYVLPACLVLILMTTDIEGLKRIGRLAFTAILGSTILVLVSGTAVFFLFHQTLGQETWKAAATLSASWIGGTAPSARRMTWAIRIRERSIRRRVSSATRSFLSGTCQSAFAPV